VDTYFFLERLPRDSERRGSGSGIGPVDVAPWMLPRWVWMWVLPWSVVRGRVVRREIEGLDAD
jgi:hypothetical protein